MLALCARPSLGFIGHEPCRGRGCIQCNDGSGQKLDRRFVQIVGKSWHVAVPGAVTAVLAFAAGGYFAVTTGLAVACLCLLLVAHVTLAERPFAGWSAPLAVMAGALALFVVWTTALGRVVGLPGAGARRVRSRALVPADAGVRGAARARPGAARRRCCAGSALAIAVASAIALLTRLLPATFPTKAGVNNERPAFPLTYWNAMGIVLRARRGARARTSRPPSASRRRCGWRRGGAPRRRGDALLHVLARRRSRWRSSARSLYMILAHPRGSGRRRCRPPGSRWRSRCTSAYGAELLAAVRLRRAPTRARRGARCSWW